MIIRWLIMLIIAALLIWGFADNSNYQDILMAEANPADGVSFSALEDINQGRYMLTYKNEYQRRIEALNTRHDVTIIGTNYTWPFVMELPIISGHFFSLSDQTHRNRMAVLNGPAAFAIFGDYSSGGIVFIDSERYVVTGVIADGQEDPFVYIPAAILSNRADTVIMRLEYDLTREMAKGILSAAGVIESRYEFTDFRQLRQLREERFVMAFYVALFAELSLLLKKNLRVFAYNKTLIKTRLSEVYVRELWKNERFLLITTTGVALFAVMIAVTQFAIILRAFEILLIWYDVLM